MKFIIGFLISIGLLIFVFILIFRGGNASDQKTTQNVVLADYANSSTVVMQYTEEGPVTADPNHTSTRITVGKDQASIEVFKGYEGPATTTKTYANNSTAYLDFLRALQLSGYTLGTTDKALASERGRCPTGTRYIMGIKDGERDVQRFWSTSCGGVASFKGKTSLVRDLFIRQIPDYGTVSSNLNL